VGHIFPMKIFRQIQNGKYNFILLGEEKNTLKHRNDTVENHGVPVTRSGLHCIS
jgi:hypothetical protein